MPKLGVLNPSELPYGKILESGMWIEKLAKAFEGSPVTEADLTAAQLIGSNPDFRDGLLKLIPDEGRRQRVELIVLLADSYSSIPTETTGVGVNKALRESGAKELDEVEVRVLDVYLKAATGHGLWETHKPGVVDEEVVVENGDDTAAGDQDAGAASSDAPGGTMTLGLGNKLLARLAAADDTGGDNADMDRDRDENRRDRRDRDERRGGREDRGLRREVEDLRQQVAELERRPKPPPPVFKRKDFVLGQLDATARNDFVRWRGRILDEGIPILGISALRHHMFLRSHAGTDWYVSELNGDGYTLEALRLLIADALAAEKTAATADQIAELRERLRKQYRVPGEVAEDEDE